MLPAGRAHAAASGSELRFLFVFARYGWDIVHAFYDSTQNGAIHTPNGSVADSFGDLSYVAHVDRPAVTDFFSAHGADSLIVNGVWTSSIAHDTCEQYILKGGTAPGADWGALIAGAQADRFTLPHVVTAGPAYAAGLEGVQVRVGTGGKLDQLITGDLIMSSANSDTQPGTHGADVEALLLSHLQGRLETVDSRSDAHGAGLSAYQFLALAMIALGLGFARARWGKFSPEPGG
jgi:hypothetical protein